MHIISPNENGTYTVKVYNMDNELFAKQVFTVYGEAKQFAEIQQRMILLGAKPLHETESTIITVEELFESLGQDYIDGLLEK